MNCQSPTNACLGLSHMGKWVKVSIDDLLGCETDESLKRILIIAANVELSVVSSIENATFCMFNIIMNNH